MSFRIVVFGLLLVQLTAGSSDDPQVILTSDSPAVLDTPLEITAVLKNVPESEGPFFWSFNDDASPMHSKEIQTDGLSTNYTLTYNSDEYYERDYQISCRVYVNYILHIRSEIASNVTRVRATKNLNGRIVVEYGHNTTVNIEKGVATLPTHSPSKFDVKLHDPSGSFDPDDIEYFWFVNGSTYGQAKSFGYNFKTIGLTDLEAFVITKPIPTDVDSQFQVANSSKDLEKVVVPSDVKTGMFRLKVDAREEMTGVKVFGDKMLKHGTLLNLTVTCNGTGPWTYCWRIKDSNYNSTGNETCGEAYETMTTCEFPIVWYLRNSGESAVLVIVDNVLNHIVKQVGINVYDVPRRTPVSLIVIPMCSGLIAVMACISGVFVFMTFKRNMTGLETADFDFSCPDEQLEYKTFWERLRDSMVNALSNSHKDAESHVSSVSSRSVQGPPLGIHYGSIT